MFHILLVLTCQHIVTGIITKFLAVKYLLRQTQTSVSETTVTSKTLDNELNDENFKYSLLSN